MKIFTSAVIKGGTGKTTTTAALAQLAVSQGKKVLAIDTDPQSNLTIMLGGDSNVTGTNQLLQGVVFADCVQHTEQDIDLISGNPELAVFDGKSNSLKKAIEPIKKDYDYIFIDTPPMIGKLTYNALFACDELLIPLESDMNSLEGLFQITDIAKRINTKRAENPLIVAGVVLTRYDGRAKLNKLIRDKIENACNDMSIPFLGCVRTSIAIREAQAMQKSIYIYAQKCNSAIDYLNIYTKIK